MKPETIAIYMKSTESFRLSFVEIQEEERVPARLWACFERTERSWDIGLIVLEFEVNG
jgi:hypothetical protein